MTEVQEEAEKVFWSALTAANKAFAGVITGGGAGDKAYQAISSDFNRLTKPFKRGVGAKIGALNRTDVEALNKLEFETMISKCNDIGVAANYRESLQASLSNLAEAAQTLVKALTASNGRG